MSVCVCERGRKERKGERERDLQRTTRKSGERRVRHTHTHARKDTHTHAQKHKQEHERARTHRRTQAERKRGTEAETVAHRDGADGEDAAVGDALGHAKGKVYLCALQAHDLVQGAGGVDDQEDAAADDAQGFEAREVLQLTLGGGVVALGAGHAQGGQHGEGAVQEEEVLQLRLRAKALLLLARG